MKLLIVLSIIAFGYADKLDRAYLPPVNAATAGGSPGALIAPGVSATGQPGSSLGQGGPVFGQELPSGGKPESGQSSPAYGGFPASAQSGPGFGSGINQFQSGSGLIALAPGSNGKVPLLGANAPFGTSQNTFRSSPGLATSFNVGGQQTYRSQPGDSSSQGFGQGTQGFNVHQGPQSYKSERPQAAADRNAEILKYINENNGEYYQYSYETSNGISAEESGIATNGVKAQGGFSYTGDDGQAYSLTYTADENGFQPQGEHLPTPHPIPEEILKSIEENARAAAAGTQEGAYRPEEYESDSSPQQYNVGQTSLNRSPGQNQGSIQGSFSQRPASQAQSSVNQGSFGPSSQSGQTGRISPTQGFNQFASGLRGPERQITQYQKGSGYNQGPDSQFGQSGQIGQVQPSQGSSQYAVGKTGPQGKGGQYQTGLGSSQGSFSQASGQGPNVKGLGQISQVQDSNGYNYNQPQNAFGSATQFGFGESVQNRPQANQGQITPTFGSKNGQGSIGLQSGKVVSSETPFGTSQFGSSQNLNRPGNRPASLTFGQGQNQLNVNKPFGSSQGSQVRPGNQGVSEPTVSESSGYQYTANGNRPTFGNRPSGINSQSTQGSQYQPKGNQPSVGANNGIKGSTQFGNTVPNGQIGQGQQYQQNGNRPFGGNIGSNQGISPFGGSSGIQKTGPGSMFGQAYQPSFGSNVGSSQGSSLFGSPQSTLEGTSGTKGSLPIQAPYQYNKPAQSFPTQQRPVSPGYSGVNGPTSGNQGINEKRPGESSYGSQGANVRPGSPGSQGEFGQRSGYTGSQGANGRPALTGSQGVNGQPPYGSSLGLQGVTGQRPGSNFSGSQGVIGQRPAFTANQGVDQRPDGTSPGSQGVNGQRPGSNQGDQGKPEQFGGPRQPPSFNPQEGYKY